MSTNTSTADLLARFQPRKETLLWGVLVVNLELALLAMYVVVGGGELIRPAAIRYWLYPFVWINVGAWAILRTTPAPTGDRQRWTALAIAGGYLLVLSYFGGVVGPANPGPAGIDLRLFSIPPGWGPAILYNGAFLSVVLLPYKVLGYAALTYLVYATVIDAAGSAVSGLLGLLSCVSCSWPILATLVTGVAGSGTALAGAAYSQSYGLSTLVFVVTVALLYWRPFGR
jgi:hypothetical protein